MLLIYQNYISGYYQPVCNLSFFVFFFSEISNTLFFFSLQTQMSVYQVLTTVVMAMTVTILKDHLDVHKRSAQMGQDLIQGQVNVRGSTVQEDSDLIQEECVQVCKSTNPYLIIIIILVFIHWDVGEILNLVIVHLDVLLIEMKKIFKYAHFWQYFLFVHLDKGHGSFRLHLTFSIFPFVLIRHVSICSITLGKKKFRFVQMGRGY